MNVTPCVREVINICDYTNCIKVKLRNFHSFVGSETSRDKI